MGLISMCRIWLVFTTLPEPILRPNARNEIFGGSGRGRPAENLISSIRSQKKMLRAFFCFAYYTEPYRFLITKIGVLVTSHNHEKMSPNGLIFSWLGRRDSVTFSDPETSPMKAQLSREDFLANCHWQFSPPYATRVFESQSTIDKVK